MANTSSGKYEVTARGDLHKLHGKAIGLPGVLFLTVTGAAPISAMLFNVPIGVGYGNGLGAPAAFLVATIVLLLFSVGYAAMARKVTAVGGFYSFISHGLGRPAGMALGFGSIVAYCVFETSLAGGFAYFANADVLQWTGVNIAWPWFAFGMVAAIAVLSFFDVKLSAIVLGVALIAEVVILVIFDLGVFGHVGNGATVNAAALNPVAAFQAFDGFKTPDGKDIAGGIAAIGLFFAFWSWVGFEMAPNYGEESRDPKRIVPLSLYISVLGLGIFYTITSWAAVSAYPDTNSAIAKAATDSGNFFLDPAGALIGPWAKDLMSVLILTSSFACGMAFHNTAARYIYSLAREGVLPAKLGRTHATFRSPAHRLDHPVGAGRDHHRAVHDLRRHRRSDRPGLSGAVRPDGPDGDGADHVRPGAGLGGDHCLLPAQPSGRASLVRDHARAGDRVCRPDLHHLSALGEHRLPGRRLELCPRDPLDRLGDPGRRLCGCILA